MSKNDGKKKHKTAPKPCKPLFEDPWTFLPHHDLNTPTPVSSPSSSLNTPTKVAPPSTNFSLTHPLYNPSSRSRPKNLQIDGFNSLGNPASVRSTRSKHKSVDQKRKPYGASSSKTKGLRVELREMVKDCETVETRYDVNEVIERAGWGWYHYKAMLVMGLASFAECSDVYLAAVILNSIVCEWNLSTIQQALIPALTYFCCTVGSMLSGQMADYFGRCPVLLANSYMLVVSAVGSALVPNYYLFLTCRSVTGFCIGGIYSVAMAYSSEIQPIAKRSLNMLILFLFGTLGRLYPVTVAYYNVSVGVGLTGWRVQILLTAVPYVLMLILMHFMDDSPRYLAITNQVDKAKVVVVKMCRQNCVEPPEGRIVCRTVKKEAGFIVVFTQPHTRSSILLTVLFFCNMYGVFGAIILIPDTISYDWCGMTEFIQSHSVNKQGCNVNTREGYLFEMGLAALWFAGFIIGFIMAESIGRISGLRLGFFAGAFFSGLSLLCYNNYLTYSVLIGMVISYGAVTIIMWIHAAELYPSYARAAALGTMNGVGKLGAIAGTLVAGYLNKMEIQLQYMFYTFIGVYVVGFLTSLFFKSKDEMKGKALLDTKGDVETMFASVKQTDYGAASKATNQSSKSIFYWRNNAGTSFTTSTPKGYVID